MSEPADDYRSPATLAHMEKITNSARNNIEWDQVYQAVASQPKRFFVILPGRRWSVAHQVVYHGDVDRLKTFLALFSADEVNLHFRTQDNKTYLDIARERQAICRHMYNFVQFLYAFDALVENVRRKDWPTVMGALHQDGRLINGKPPYAPCCLLHYVVEFGDANELEHLLRAFPFQIDVKDKHNETPSDLANRLNKRAMWQRLNATNMPQSKVKTPTDQRVTPHPKPGPSPSLAHEPPAAIGFGPINEKVASGAATDKSDVFVFPPDAPPKQPLHHKFTKKSIVSQSSASDLSSPSPPASSKLLKDVTCPLTGKTFVDPVIASDGHTYERVAIADWIDKYHTSPTTKTPMSATLVENIALKKIIQLTPQ